MLQLYGFCYKSWVSRLSAEVKKFYLFLKILQKDATFLPTIAYIVCEGILIYRLAHNLHYL